MQKTSRNCEIFFCHYGENDLPGHDSLTSIEQALLKRRSVRDYKDEPLTLTEVSQLLWAAQGITDPRDFRTSPSAGALYPLEVYVVAGNVDNLSDGIYKYKPMSMSWRGLKKEIKGLSYALLRWDNPALRMVP